MNNGFTTLVYACGYIVASAVVLYFAFMAIAVVCELFDAARNLFRKKLRH